MGAANGSTGQRRWPIIATAAVTLLAVDQIVKALVVGHLALMDPVHVIGSFLQFHLTYNCGAAWSFGTGFTWLFTALATCATVLILWLAPRCRDGVWALALGILLAGVDGNLADRLFRAPGAPNGCVVDFIAFPHYPVFNIADICINIAAALIVLQIWRGIRLDGTRTKNPKDTE